MSSYASKELISFFGQAFESQENVSQINMCEAALIGCTGRNGHSLDDCLGGTIPVCIDDAQVNVSAIKPANMCCPSGIKETYVEARCSGLDAISSAFTLRGNGFHESYTVPSFLTYTKEYLELSKSRSKAKEDAKNKQ